MGALLALLSLFAARAVCGGIDNVRVLGPQAVNLWQLEARNSDISASDALPSEDDSDELLSALERKFPAHWFTQPLDHFTNASGHTFEQRYWISTRHYRPRPDAPVIVLDGGETSGRDRLPFLDTGIVEILTKATGGVGVILEHRYYGRTIPVQNFTTDSLRWLNNAQSAADSANFMANVKFPGIDEDLAAPNHPWIYYGGSYAGARAAHMKILYPDLVYGAIASSGVTHAALELWEYAETIRRAADATCAQHLENSIKIIDALLDVPVTKYPLKALFGLAKLRHDEDFVSLLQSPIGGWQGKVWDPEVGSTSWDEFCTALDKSFVPWDAPEVLSYDEDAGLVAVTEELKVPLPVYNYAQYIKSNYVSRCPNGAVEECFGTYDDAKYQGTDLSQTWRLWMFQVCTEWGYFMTAPPEGQPRIISRRIDLAYESKLCKQAFVPGKDFIVPPLPNITAVNSLGDFDIAADRLAIIDGEVDPWRPATPHSEYARDRPDTILQPYKIIPNAVHHYDEYGRRNLSEEPIEIQQIHEQMIGFVVSWLSDWEVPAAA
ncbi:peptidase S28 [Trametes versicolor FP-101664 SS1]|uniref:peptidase S28 n=1 Tax=Trametes versicolor (strain FP-101664) TaxID=717944 RepID=UPI0004623072|nr:peptidase S28 [Trametes versicolor FP-101664 SS1]EIW59107.1 peptidase S28 [Trametes versicolor FP-101664 SS1]